MSIGLKEKKKETESVDKKQEKSSSPKAIKESSSSISVSSAEEPDVFDSYRDNAMSEMRQIADMEPDNVSKVFSHVEEKQSLDPSKISVNDDNEQKIDSEEGPKANSDSNSSSSVANPNPTVEEIDSSTSPPSEVTLKQNIKQETNHDHVHKPSELNRVDNSVRFHDSQNQEIHANPLNNDDNPIIQMIKGWQEITTTWINLWNDFMKFWIVFRR
jgi:hypothetical protein